MKKKIDFYILGAGRPYSGYKHPALKTVESSINVLDWILDAVDYFKPDCYFISGYASDKIREQYPDLNYIHNKYWETTRASWSLLNALPINHKETLVSYSDIVYLDSTVRKIMDADGDVVVAIDSHWKSRYVGRNSNDIEICEKVFVKGDEITVLGNDLDYSQSNAEFIGLVRFSEKSVAKLCEIKKYQNTEIIDLKQANLSNLIELLRINGMKIQAIEVHGAWAELNEPADLARFILGTKAQTLDRLNKLVKMSNIEDQFSFTVHEWNKNSNDIISKIFDFFGNKNLIIRSSALSEDSFLKSNAGAFSSILDVPSVNPLAVKDAIDKVIYSYIDKNPKNEILIQPMLKGVKLSGVVLTRNLTTGAPYYVINFDDESGSTETITSGTSKNNKTFTMIRNTNELNNAIPKDLKNLLPAIREIETLIGYDCLDIEFAITSDNIFHVLQVRPLNIRNSPNNFLDESIYSTINKAKIIFQNHQGVSPFLVGDWTVFGIMPDWNPAEIIGIKPSILATSLYQNLIMNEIWAIQRSEYGYRDVRPHPLLTSFVKHPYVDVRVSFNSFVPNDLPDKLAKKLVEFCMKWLEKNPQLHDKVEFDVIPTCFDLNFSRWEKRFCENNLFNLDEIDQIRKSFLKLTQKALQTKFQKLELLKQLEKRYKKIRDSNFPPLEKVFFLLDDVRRFGTLPFAHLARDAFVAVSLLRSAMDANILLKSEYDDFLSTIHTVSQDLNLDTINFAEGKLSMSDFLEKYGHLRPGTYDISSPSYRQDIERYLRPSLEKSLKKKRLKKSDVGLIWKKARKKFGEAVLNAGLKIKIEKLEKFIKIAIEGREYAKFVFTRNLSLALDELISWGKLQNVNAETLAQISIDDLRTIRSGDIYADNIEEWINHRAKQNKKNSNISEILELPPLITNINDFSAFQYPTTYANFIGNSKITAKCIVLEKKQRTDLNLQDKIILVSEADPGYDWIFSQNIAGLITKYGGANSHMAIRAAEFGLPAAVGIGEINYRRLKDASKLELNAISRIIRIVC